MSDTVPVPASELAHLRSVYVAARRVAALDMALRRGQYPSAADGKASPTAVVPDRMSVIQAHRELVALFEEVAE